MSSVSERITDDTKNHTKDTYQRIIPEIGRNYPLKRVHDALKITISNMDDKIIIPWFFNATQIIF